MSSTEVLVVGAGPVGMTMAMELSIQGVSYRIVDKTHVRSDKSRALGVHTRTVEALSRYGDVRGDVLSKVGQQMSGNAVWVNRKQYVMMDNSKTPPPVTKETPESQFGGPYVVTQVATEAYLEDGLAERGVKVEYATNVKSIVQDDDGVTVVLTKPDGAEENLRVKYVVGCDGAHSIVRHSMNVNFEGDAYKQEFILADCLMDWDIDGIDRLIQIMLGDGLVMIIPMGNGRVRITASRPDHTGKDENDEPTLPDFEDLILKLIPAQESFPKPKLHTPYWLSRFHLHHRCVTKYRDGRLFVAGDAAHIHSPIGGQGMNTGMQDSVNLGWKLARVLQGHQPDKFLDSYHEERWPVGQHLLTQTDQIFSSLTTGSKMLQFLRNMALPWIAPWVASRPQASKGVLHYMSQLGVKYRRSPIVHTAEGFEGPVKGGFRAPEGRVLLANGEEQWMLDQLTGPGYHLLVFSDDAEEIPAAAKFQEDLKEDVRVHKVVSTKDKQEGQGVVVDVDGVLHQRYGFSSGKGGFALVRPDGYIADIGYL